MNKKERKSKHKRTYRLHIGFYEWGSHELEPLKTCLELNTPNLWIWVGCDN